MGIWSDRRAGRAGGWLATKWLATKWLAVLWAGAALAGCGKAPPPRAARASEGGDPVAEAISVRVEPVRRAAISSLYSTSATLRADKRATITARTHGVIRSLLVEEGDRVEAEQAVAVLEDEEQRIALDRYKAVLEIKNRELERSRKLHEEAVVSDNEFEVVRREAEEAKHDVEMADLNLRRTVIRAPFGGIIVARHLDPGTTVNDGTAVYDVSDLDPLYADVNVPERHVTRLAPGQTVRLAADATGDVVQARIERISPAVDPGSGTVKVTLAVEPSASIRPGAFVRVDVVTDTHPDALVVPRSALAAEGRRWNLFRAVGDDKVEMLPVRLGFEEGDRVEILEVESKERTGLEPGDRVVVVGASALTDGARIRILEP